MFGKNYGRVSLMTLSEARNFFFTKEFKNICVLNGRGVGLIIIVPKKEKPIDLPSFARTVIQLRFDSCSLEELKDVGQTDLISDQQADQLIAFIKASRFVEQWYIASSEPGVSLSVALILCRIKSWNEMRTLGDLKLNGVPDHYVFFKLCKQAGINCELQRILGVLSNRYRKNHPEDVEFSAPISDREEEDVITQHLKVTGAL